MRLFLRNIKRGFATNSSSYHAAIILTEEEYKKWQNNEFTIKGLTKEELDGETENENGMFMWLEDRAERIIDGVKVIALSFMETNEY